jgi:hypothetical protein
MVDPKPKRVGEWIAYSYHILHARPQGEVWLPPGKPGNEIRVGAVSEVGCPGSAPSSQPQKIAVGPLTAIYLPARRTGVKPSS